MHRSELTLSYEQIAHSLEAPGPPPCLQATEVPAGARSFLLARLAGRLNRPVLYLVPSGEEAEEAFHELCAYLGPDRVRRYPSLEIPPYRRIPAFAPAVHERMRALAALAFGPKTGGGLRSPVVVAPAPALREKTIPPGVFSGSVLRIRPGQEIDLEDLCRRLSGLGYGRLPVTSDPGDFSVRGGIVDLFSPFHPLPVRILFDGDRVESIRRFDPGIQRTREEAEEAVVLPVSQVIGRPELLEAAAARCLPGDAQAFRQGIRFHGSDGFLPWLYGRASSLLDHLPEGALVAAADSALVQGELWNGYADAQDRYALSAEGEAMPSPRDLFLCPEEMQAALSAVPLLCFDGIAGAPFGRAPSVRGRMEIEGNEDIRRRTVVSSSEGLLLPLVECAKEWWKRGGRFVVSSLSPSQADRMEELLSRYPIPLASGAPLADCLEGGAGIRLCVSGLSRGFRIPELSVAVVPESEIFGGRGRVRRARKETAAPVEEFSLRELKVNDLAVHVDHGIGIYRGLMRKTAGGVEGDFLLLEYAGGDRLFVPVPKLDRVQRYVASEEGRPRLAKLGGTAWQRAKERVRDSLLAMAQELVEISARRKVATRAPGAPPDAAFREFEAAFPHEETPDQQRAIAEVLADLASARPMDRLVCGDVGYGKTEVAVRAAFKAAIDGRQTAVLVPTTILAEQHFRTFRERLAGYPVRVEDLSRFRSRKEQAEVLRGLVQGAVHIVIGTHRLLQRDVRFRDLGLVVIDEEQRFGVAHKERLKKMRAAVDVLTLTATPIPRTLHMALSGIRDISVIATPPEDRLSIRTFVLPFSGDTIREAVEREVRRGGQVFFVHNRVQSMEAVERYLRELLPGIRLVSAHGQMEEERLAGAMEEFAARRADLLLCSAIIESGLDLANANTIVVNHAHRYGLAQLYQLRGRVGRDRHRAYCYFLLPKDVAMTKEAVRRLAAISELTELGSGFRLASHDLEIRGGGNLLGKDQSGHIHQVGYELYAQLLDEAVAEISGRSLPEEEEPELDLRIPAFLPDDWLPEAGTRLDVYRRLASARTEEAVDEVELELLDRFGRLPAPAEALCDLSRLRAGMRKAGVRELKRGDGHLYLTLSARSEIDRRELVRLVTREKASYGFVRGEVLSARIPGKAPAEVLHAAKNLLRRLAAGE